MKKNVLRRNIAALLAVFVIMFTGLIVYLGYVNAIYGERWFATPYNPRIHNMKTTVKAGDILDRTGRKLLYTDGDKRRYIKGESLRNSIAHIVGDEYGLSYGAQIMYAKYLYGSVTDPITRITQLLTGDERRGSDVRLTIDAKLCEAAYAALGKSNGAVVVMNYKTGEILASVSKPSFDPAEMEEFEQGGGTSELVNRAFSGLYPPGSTFKVITAAAMLERGMEDFTATCTGSTTIDGNEITCTGEHGEIGLEEALEESCNVYFAEAAVKMGGEALKAEAEKFLFNRQLMFDDLVMKDSVFEPGGGSDTAWAAVGQYHDLTTPLHACMIAAAIANDGVMAEPKLLMSVSNGGVSTYRTRPQIAATPLGDTEKLKEMMLSAVKNGTGKKAAIKGHKVAGKTGTAQVNIENGETADNAWFIGFIDEEEHPIAIAIVMEKAGSGGSKAAPVAQKVLKKALDIGY